MDRKEAYQKIKEYNLQDAVMKVSGKNFTQTSTEVLVHVISTYEDANTKEAKTPVTESVDTLEGACLAFLGILKDTGNLDSLLAKL